MPTITSFKVNDRVTFPDDALIKPSLIGVVFVVEEVPSGRKRNYRVRAENGGPRYSVRPGELIPAPDASETTSIGRPFVPMEFYEKGEIVTVTSRSGKIAKDQPMVVCDDRGRNTVQVAVLGGPDAYNWPRAGVVRRDLAWLTERLVEMA
jgi:hypothetical protein